MSNIRFTVATAEPVILAIDTSSRRVSLAVSRGEDVIASLMISDNRPHSQTIFSNIAALLDIAGINTTDINAFAAATGPGSFTGLRVGLSAVKGLAFGLGMPSLGINSLDILALSTGFNGIHFTMIEAGRGEVYAGMRAVAAGEIYEHTLTDKVGKPALVLNELMQDLNNELMQDLKSPSLIITGDGACRFKEEVQTFTAKLQTQGHKAFRNHILIQHDISLNTSIALVKRSSSLLKSGRITPIQPHYIRGSDVMIKCSR
jgi:tRNA threonylcarbamoyladenosine biosynthesis protein TsaB